MAVLRLTPANLKSIKQTLRPELPSVKSSHLTEAIAAALGFRTHAALLAAVGNNGPGSEPLARIDEGLAAERLIELSQVPLGALWKVQAQRSAFPDPCWREASVKDSRALNEWYYECKRLKLPYIVVRTAKKYATLEWDCITVDADCDEGFRGDNSRESVRMLFAVFQQHCVAETGRPMFEGSAFVGKIERLIPETARAIADEFFALLYGVTRPVR